MIKVRGFEPVAVDHRKNVYKTIQEHATVKTSNGDWVGDVQLPQRATRNSAGYDFFAPRDIKLLPAQKTIVWTDIKAKMQEGEVLQLYPRSSLGIKKGLMLSNTVGIVDADYYSNQDNDGNIGLSLLNTTGKTIEIRKGERIVQGIFMPYLITDHDNVETTREGGVGSTGE